MDLLSDIDASLKIKKVGIEEFAESDEFCNKRLYPRQKLLLKLIFLEPLTGQEEDVLDYWIAGGRGGDEIRVSPKIRERIQYLRDNGFPHFREVVLVGGRRSSKGYCTGIAMAKVMHDALQLQDPGIHYGIDPDKEIYFSCVASAELQAKKFQYADLLSTIESCRAFDPHLVKTLETEFLVATAADLRKASALKGRGTKIQRDLGRLRGNALASNAGTLRGSATMALCIDEMAHMLPGETKASAEQVYDAAEPSLDQFRQDALIFCNSSPYTKIGKFHERFAAATELNEDGSISDPIILAVQFPSWALYEGYQDDPERRFKRAIQVSPDWDPEEKDENGELRHSHDDRAAILIARNKEKSNPDKYKVERRGQFSEIIDAYLMPHTVDRMYAGKPQIAVGDTYQVDLVPYTTNWDDSRNIYRYKAHLDPSSTTAGFGFAMGHIEEYRDEDGNMVEHVVFDIIKRWDPKSFPGEVIQWEPIIQEVSEYADLFRPYEITMDQFQSASPIQQLSQTLAQKKISGTRVYVKTATNELNWNRWEVFKTGLYQNLIHAPMDDTSYHSSLELKFLQQVNTAGRFPRVQKQEIGPVQTQDMADCIAEVTWSLIGNSVTRIRLSELGESVAFGAAGGYKIGGLDGGGRGQMPPEIAALQRGRRVGEQRSTGGHPIRGGSSARDGLRNPSRSVRPRGRGGAF